MEQQVAVLYFVQAAMLQEKAHMALELLAVLERSAQLLDNRLLAGGKLIGILPVHRGKDGVDQFVLHAINHDGTALAVHQVQQVAVLQAKAGVLGNELGLHLELNDGHGLLDLLGQRRFGIREPRAVFKPEGGTGVVGIGFGGEGGQRAQIDAVGVFQNVQVAVASADAHHVGHAARLSQRRAHPQDVMIAPLHVHVGERQQLLHDELRRRTAVVHVAHQMQLVYHQALDKGAQGHGEGHSLARLQIARHNGRAIDALGRIGRIGRYQLLHERKILGDQRADCVEGGRSGSTTGHGHGQRQLLGQVSLKAVRPRRNKSALFLRVEDKAEQLGRFIGGQLTAERLCDKRAHGTRATAQHMGERVELAVDVGGEQLGAPRQGTGCLKLDQSSGRLGPRGIPFRQQLTLRCFQCAHGHPPWGKRRRFLRRVGYRVRSIVAVHNRHTTGIQQEGGQFICQVSGVAHFLNNSRAHHAFAKPLANVFSIPRPRFSRPRDGQHGHGVPGGERSESYEKTEQDI